MLRQGNTSISKTLQLFHGSKSSIINFAWITCGCFLLVSFSGQLLNVGKVTHYRKTFPKNHNLILIPRKTTIKNYQNI